MGMVGPSRKLSACAPLSEIFLLLTVKGSVACQETFDFTTFPFGPMESPDQVVSSSQELISIALFDRFVGGKSDHLSRIEKLSSRILDSIVEMGTRGDPGRPNAADLLSLRDRLACFDTDPGEVAVHRGVPVCVSDSHLFPESALPPGQRHPP